jgi:hypothetical protein
MPYNVNRDSGMAERQNKMQLTPSDVIALTGIEGDGGTTKDKRFAELVYQVNTAPITISGDVVVDSVGIDDSGTVKLSGDQLKTFDQGVVDAVNNLVPSNYSSVIQTRGTNVFIAEANVGTSYATSGWRVQKIEETGTTTWADGSNFSQPANVELSGLTFTP